MAMTAGSVSMDVHGVVTGTGFAKAFWDDYSVKIALPAGTPATALRGLVDLCNSLATVIDFIKSNAEVAVAVKTTDAGLQRLPAAFVASADTVGPSADKALAGTLT